MIHTPLLNKILEIATEKQNELSCRVMAVEFVYLAFRSVVDNPSILNGIDYDQEEFDSLKKMMADVDSFVPKSEVETKVSNMDFTKEDETEAKTFTRWLSVSSRDSVAAWKKIADDFKVEKPKMEPLVEGDTQQAEEKPAEGVKVRPLSQPKTEEGEAEASGEKTKETTEVKEPENVKDLVEITINLRTKLLEDVLGQNYAVNKLVDGFFTGELAAETSPKRKGVRSSFLFLGTPGVGKTFLAETFAEALGRPFLRLDMSGYSNEISGVEQLTGIPASFHGSREGELTCFVKNNPKSVVLFDEVEKAHMKVVLVFLQMLDSGMVVDSLTKKPVNFEDVIVIFTTNAGKNLYSNTEYGRLSGIPDVIIKDALAKDLDPSTQKPFFPEAIVSRLGTGAMILFDNLPAADLIKISGKELNKNVTNIETKYEQSFSIDSRLDATLLYSLGGDADARNAVANAKKFLSAEYFELLRLVGANKGMEALLQLKDIKIKVDLDGITDEVEALYDATDGTELVIFGEEKYRKYEQFSKSNCVIKYCDTLELFEEIIHSDEPSMALIDYGYHTTAHSTALSLDDVESDGRKAFQTVINDCPETKIFILDGDSRTMNLEEKMSILDKGANDFMELPVDDDMLAHSIIDGLCEKVCQQRALETLAMKHKVLSYDTRQTISEDYSHAEIILYDLRIAQAVESEDRKAILSAENKPNKHWDDIVVSKDIEEELAYCVEYLRSPKEYLSKGAPVPKGILMYGPPGTGKTSLAKVVATESGVTFLEVGADQLISKWVGESAENVHKIFATARKYAPAILFIDELDAIGSRRDESGLQTAGTNAVHQALNALLAEMDGFKTSVKKPVFVMAATNLGGNNGNTGALDPALVRRFDRSINIDLPDKEGRIKIIQNLCKKNEKMVQVTDEMIENLAVRSMGMSPANIEGAMDTAIRDAIRAGVIVDDKILDNAFEKYTAGDEKKWDEEELERTARHEAGHAFICNYFGEKPSYLTIIARADHGGYMMHGDNEKKGNYLKQDLLHRICTSLGGRAAEIVYYGPEEGISTGASGDLENATNIARGMVAKYGMCGTLGVTGRHASPDQNARIEEQTNQLLQEQLDVAIEILKANVKTVDKLVAELLDKQHLSEDQIQAILNPEGTQETEEA